MKRHLGLRSCVCPVHKGPDHTTWGFSIGYRDGRKAYLDWLYADCHVCLERKRAKYREFLAEHFPG